MKVRHRDEINKPLMFVVVLRIRQTEMTKQFLWSARFYSACVLTFFLMTSESQWWRSRAQNHIMLTFV